MDSSPPPTGPSQTVEAGDHGLPQAARSRVIGARRRGGRGLLQTLVENGWSRRASNGSAQQLLRPYRSPEACELTSTFRTAGYGPVRPVVWEGSSGMKPATPYPDPRHNLSTAPSATSMECMNFLDFRKHVWAA